MKRALFAVLVCFTLLSSGALGLDVNNQNNDVSKGTTLYVGGVGSDNYSSIQDAINASNHGDTVFVYRGTYNENITIDKSINLFGENRENTVINRGDMVNRSFYDSTVLITADYVTLSGMLIATEPHGPFYSIIVKSNNTCIKSNKFINCLSSINLVGNSNNSVDDNIFESVDTAIVIDHSNNACVSNNTIEADWGIFVMGLYDVNERIQIINNTIYGSSLAVFFYGAGALMKYNSFFNCGLRFIPISSYPTDINDIDTTNTINGKKIYHYSSRRNIIVPNNAGQIILENCDNCVIKNQNLDSCTVGITLINSKNIYVYNNSIVNVSKSIALCDSQQSIIYNNYGETDEHGIEVAYSTQNRIIDNTIKRVDSDSFPFGIINLLSDNNSFYYNTVKRCYLGMILSECNNTLVFNNNFESTYPGVYDDRTNIWNKTLPVGGNYWEDYNGIDDDNDGLGDTPYTVFACNISDYFPYMQADGWLEKLPTINLIYPNEETTLSGTTTFEGTAQDNQGNISSISFIINGEQYYQNVTNENTSLENWQFEIDTKELPDGLAVVMVESTDDDGFLSKPQIFIYFIDNQNNQPPNPPSIDGPTRGRYKKS